MSKLKALEATANFFKAATNLINRGVKKESIINFSPSKGNDKHTRVNAVSPLFESGRIWAPKEMEFAQEVIEECAAFPFGDHDDLVDSMTQAVMRFRQGGFIEHPEDAPDEELPQRQRTYY